MKKIKTINKLLSSLTLLSPLSGIGFNNQYQNTQKVITENNNDALINSFRSNAEPVQMGDIWVTVDDSDPTIITGYSSGNGTLTVASNIKQIKDDAFHEGTPELQGLDLSQAISLTTIGDQAFYSCKNLTGDLVIPSSVTNIGQFAFYTTKITSLDLSNATSLTTIGQGGFNSTNITSLDLSQATSLITIEPTTFEYCTNLTGNITIPSSVTTIDNYAFHGTNITSLDLSQATSLTTIGYQTFHSCTNLTGDLVFPSSIRIIGGSCFGNSNIKNLYFLSENPPTSFGANWQPTVTGKVYVPSEEAKSKYTSAENFGFTEEQIEVIGVSGKTLINIDEKSTDSEHLVLQNEK